MQKLSIPKRTSKAKIATANMRFIPKGGETIIFKRMLMSKADGYFKKGNFTTEIIWRDTSYKYSELKKRQQNTFRKGLFLFAMVRSDAKKFIKENPKLGLPKKYASIEWNQEQMEFGGKPTATDLNHAYWRIAYNHGIISDRTYNRGLDDRFKAIRLAALSTLGAGKRYQLIKKGVITDDIVEVGKNELLAKAYKLIRYTCYKYMQEVKKMLGDDFLCYKTDCIYYVDTKENRKLVRDFFKEKDLHMKQLVEVC